MSLDVYLNSPSPTICPHCGSVVDSTCTGQLYYQANITHNLGEMAEAAGIYVELWRPEGMDITHARQLIGPLRAGLERLRAEPEKFEKFNPSNGWGSYDGFVSWVERYLRACEEYPEAEVRVSR